MKFFLQLLKDYFNDSNFFVIVLRFMSMFWTNLKKQILKIWKNISKNVQLLKFHLWVCGRNFGRSAENSVKSILLPKILTKNIWSKIRPLHHQNIQKVDPPQKKWPFLGGCSHFICDLSQ